MNTNPTIVTPDVPITGVLAWGFVTVILGLGIALHALHARRASRKRAGRDLPSRTHRHITRPPCILAALLLLTGLAPAGSGPDCLISSPAADGHIVIDMGAVDEPENREPRTENGTPAFVDMPRQMCRYFGDGPAWLSWFMLGAFGFVHALLLGILAGIMRRVGRGEGFDEGYDLRDQEVAHGGGIYVPVPADQRPSHKHPIFPDGYPATMTPEAHEQNV